MLTDGNPWSLNSANLNDVKSIACSCGGTKSVGSDEVTTRVLSQSTSFGNLVNLTITIELQIFEAP